MSDDDKKTLRHMTASLVVMGLAMRGVSWTDQEQARHAVDVADALMKEVESRS